MGIGNKNNTSGFDYAGNLAKYSQGYNTSDMAKALYGMNNKNNGYILGGDADTSGKGGILANLGRIGLGAISSLGASNASSQQDYIPISNWKGNGLADISIMNNTENKQRQLGQNFGKTLMLGSLFGNGKGLQGIFGSQNNDLLNYLMNAYNGNSNGIMQKEDKDGQVMY